MSTAVLVLNDWADHWYRIVLHSSWQTALVAGMILIAVMLGRKWPAPVRYALLLIALVKFAIPPFGFGSVGVFGMAGPVIRPTETATSALQVYEQVPRSFVQIASAPLQAVITKPAPKPALTWRAGLMLVHMLGFLAVTAWIAWQVARVRFQLQSAKIAKDPAILGRFRSLGQQMGFKQLPRLMITTRACSPMAVGLLKPVILIPSALAKLSSNELQMILGHELAHIRRRDLWLNWIQLLLLAVWWFNPVLWLVNRLLRSVREDCCDDLLLSQKLTTSAEYCEGLVQAARQLTSTSTESAVVCAEKLHPLGRRVARLMDEGIPRWTRASSITLAGIALLGFFVLPGLRSQESKGTDTGPKRESKASVSTNREVSYEALFAKMRWYVSDNIFREDSEKIAQEMGTDAVPFLMKKLQKPAPGVEDMTVDDRRKAAWALGELRAENAIPALIQALQDSGSRVRQPNGDYYIKDRVCTVAALALGKMGPIATHAVPALLEASKNKVGAALLALAQIAPKSPETLRAATQGLETETDFDQPSETACRAEAIIALTQLAEHTTNALTALGSALHDRQFGQIAATALARNTNYSLLASRVMEDQLKNGNTDQQAEVAVSVTLAGKQSPAALKALLEELEDGSQPLNRMFYEALGRYGRDAEAAAGTLAKSVPKRQDDFEAYIDCLGKIARGNQEVSKTLQRLLDSRQNDRSGIIAALAHVGAAGPELKAEIIKMTYDESAEIRAASVANLSEFGISAEQGISVLEKALEDSAPDVQCAALAGLEHYGSAARNSVSKMARLLKDTGFVPATAASVFDRMGTNAAAAVPELVVALQSPNEATRMNSAHALGAIGLHDPAAIAALEHTLNDTNGAVRCNAAYSLWQIDGRLDIVPILIKRLESDKDWDRLERINPTRTRCYIAKQLGKIGPPAKAAVPSLKKYTNDP